MFLKLNLGQAKLRKDQMIPAVANNDIAFIAIKKVPYDVIQKCNKVNKNVIQSYLDNFLETKLFVNILGTFFP